MGLLQKVFDVNAAIVEKIHDIADSRKTDRAADAVALATIPFGLACEATALVATKVKKPLDTSKTYLSGKFF